MSEEEKKKKEKISPTSRACFVSVFLSRAQPKLKQDIIRTLASKALGLSALLRGLDVDGLGEESCWNCFFCEEREGQKKKEQVSIFFSSRFFFLE